MNLSRLTRLAIAAALVLPAAAQAQVEALQFKGVKSPGGDLVGSAQTGPYLAARAPFNVANTFDIYCIDMDHNFQTAWNAHYVTFAEAVGVYNVQATRQLGSEKVWGLAELRAAAYLGQQFASAPKSDWDEIHGSIWSMFSSNSAAAAHNSMVANALSVAGGDAAYDSYVLVLDDKVFDPNYSSAMSINQGFITDGGNTTIRVVTPEPSTYVLMGAGLLALGFVSRRRRTV